MGELFDRLLLLLRQQGVQGLIASALPQLNDRQQQSALAVAAHLVHADRKITPEEPISWANSYGKCHCRRVNAAWLWKQLKRLTATCWTANGRLMG